MGKGMPAALRAALAACLAAALLGGGRAAAAGGADERVPLPPELGERAVAEALQYVERGVPYVLGGQGTLGDEAPVGDEAAAGVAAEGPGRQGVDASGLVVNVFRAVLPGLAFRFEAGGEAVARPDVSSEALYRWNVRLLAVDEARPGDLLFFGRPPNRVTGVALIESTGPRRVGIVVASARAGRVIRTGIRRDGEYWLQNVVGVGRLLVPRALLMSGGA